MTSNEFAYKGEGGYPHIVNLVGDEIWRSVISYSVESAQFKWNIKNPLMLAVRVDPQKGLKKAFTDAGVPEKDADDFLLKSMSVEVAVKVDFSAENCEKELKGEDDTLYFDSEHKERLSPWSLRPKSLDSPCDLKIALRPQIRIYIGTDLATTGSDGWYSIHEPVYVSAPDGKAALNLWGALDFLAEKLWEFKRVTSLILLLILLWLLSLILERKEMRRWLSRHPRVQKALRKVHRGLEDSKDIVDKLD